MFPEYVCIPSSMQGWGGLSEWQKANELVVFCMYWCRLWVCWVILTSSATLIPRVVVVATLTKQWWWWWWWPSRYWCATYFTALAKWHFSPLCWNWTCVHVQLLLVWSNTGRLGDLDDSAQTCVWNNIICYCCFPVFNPLLDGGSIPAKTRANLPFFFSLKLEGGGYHTNSLFQNITL